MNKIQFVWRAWSYRLTKDPAEIRFMLNHLSPGDIAVDIGANKGGYTYWMAKKTGGKGRVFAFEPQAGLAQYLTAFFTKSFQNVTVEALGLSSSSGEATLVIPDEGRNSSPGASFEIQPGHPLHSVKVDVDTLDNYFGNRNARPIRFIKCDVEGHELAVFKGGENILRNDRPIMLFECEGRHLTKHSTRDVFNFLENLGYQGFFFLGRELHPLSEFDEHKHQVWGSSPYVNNFIFEPIDK